MVFEHIAKPIYVANKLTGSNVISWFYAFNWECLVVFSFKDTHSTHWPYWNWKGVAPVTDLDVLPFNLILSFTIGLQNISGIISSSLMWSEGFDIFPDHLNIYVFSISYIGMGSFPRFLRNDNRKLTIPQNDLCSFIDLGCFILIIASHFFSRVYRIVSFFQHEYETHIGANPPSFSPMCVRHKLVPSVVSITYYHRPDKAMSVWIWWKVG